MSVLMFAEQLYGSDLDSIAGKLTAILGILKYRKNFNKKTFDHLLLRWLEPTGFYFAGWQDRETNYFLGKQLFKYMSVDEVLALKVPALNSILLAKIARKGLVSDAKKILDDDSDRFLAEGSPYHNYDFSRMARVLAEVHSNGKSLNHSAETLLNAGANEFALNISGVTLLQLAAYGGSKEMVCSLLDKGWLVNKETSEGYTPLHFSAMKRFKRYSVAEALLRRGANANKQDKDGNTALHLAAHNGRNHLVIKDLVEGGADATIVNNAGKTPLDLVLDGLRNDADTDIRDHEELTRVDLPTYHELIAGAKKLVQRDRKELKVYRSDKYKRFELYNKMMAYEERAMLLIGANAKLNKIFSQGMSYLQWSVAEGCSVFLVEEIAEKSKDVNVVYDEKIGTTLDLAIAIGSDPYIIKVLVKSGANINKHFKEGMSYLHWALAQNGSKRMVLSMILHGADVNAVYDEKIGTPLAFAKRIGCSRSLINILKRAGAKN
jgi:ankyrin repeat protein